MIQLEADLKSLGNLRRSDWGVSICLFIFFACFYALTASGRIDSIDGQYRYDVTRSLLDGAGFQIRDTSLSSSVGVDGRHYGDYGPAASLLALPLCWIARLVKPGENTEMFFFSMTSGVVSAFCIAAFYCLRRRMGALPSGALFWSFALGLTSPLWPLAVSVFHQPQQAMCMLLGLYLAWESALRKSSLLGVLAGVAGGSLALFSHPLFVLVPPIGLSILETMPIKGRRPSALLMDGARRYFPFLLGALLPLGLALLFNQLRYGNPLVSGAASQPNHPPVLGNPVSGFLGLFFSPGKSILLFFPALPLVLIYLSSCFHRFPMLTVGICGILLSNIGLASTLSMWPSDWAWGPRYLMLLAPIALLPMGMPNPKRELPSWVLYSVLGVGLLVQVLGISVEHLRFFLENKVNGYFWYYDSGFYWRQSQFFARFGEFYSVVFEELPDTIRAFNSATPSGHPPTYTVSRTYPEIVSVWMRQFSVFYLPRPWPFWVSTLPKPLQPANAKTLVVLLLSGISLSLVALVWLIREQKKWLK